MLEGWGSILRRRGYPHRQTLPCPIWWLCCPNPLIPNTTPGIEVGKWGNIVTDPETGKTSMPGVFAGGDVATGAATVILAMGAGKVAARNIHDYVMGKA